MTLHPDRPRALPPRAVYEVARPDLPSLVHPEWQADFPWLVQGMTTRGADADPFDLGLFSSGSGVDTVRSNWSRLLEATGCRMAAHAEQVHGGEVRSVHARDLTAQAPPSTVPWLAEPRDGHVTADAGVLLGVTTADCVPVFLVDAERRVVAAVHAGWRGIVAGVLESAFSVLENEHGSDVGALFVHFGPSICGACYEVGPEVFEALEQPVPAAPTPIDLHAVLTARAVGAGADSGRVTGSAHCTRCTDSRLFSHRGGDAYRQVGYIGIRPA